MVSVAPPAGVVMTTSTTPVGLAGVTPVTVKESTTLTLVAATPPNVMLVAPVNPVPVKVKPVPPDAGPDVGLMVLSVLPD